MDKDEFRDLRMQYGPQAVTGLALGISQSLVSMYERGYVPIPDYIAKNIAELVNTNEKSERLNGRDVYEFRAKSGITQKQLAAALGVSHITVSNWETAGESTKLSHRYSTLLGDLDPNGDFSAEIPRYMFGCELSADDQDIALFMTPNRYTGEHTPTRAEAVGRTVWPEFDTDAEFLAGALFRVHRDGKLDRRQERIIMVPKWPTMLLWQETRPVVVLHVGHGYPRSKPNGSIRFRDRFEEESLRVRAERRDRPAAPTPQAPTIDREKIDAENAEIQAHHLAYLREQQRIKLGIKDVPAPQAPGIDLNDSPADPPTDTKTPAIIPLTHQN